MPNDSTQQMQDGSISIKNGHVCVNDPKEGGRPATISPVDNIKIYVDGTAISKKTEVKAKNNIELVPEEIPGEYRFKLNTDKKKMEAYLSAEYIPGKTYAVLDCGETTDLEDIPFVVREAPKKPLSPEAVREELAQKGITYGIDEKAIERMVSLDDGLEVLVASGTEPQLGEDARIEVCFQEGKYIEKNMDDLWVDNFDYGTVASVEAGSVVVKKIPIKPGTPGMDITGRALEPPQPKDVQLNAGAGVEISKNGLEAIALVNGRPQMKSSAVSVTPVYKVSGDVDNTTGNLNFTGDIVIEGSVQDAMKVRAKGSVKISGFATHCYVEAGGDVTIARNVVGSEIRAGGSKVSLYPVKDALTPILSKLTELSKVLEHFGVDPRIKDRPEVQKYGFGAMLKVLLDTKFNQIAPQLKALENLIESSLGKHEVIFDERLQAMAGRLGKRFTGTGPLEFKTMEEILKAVNDFIDCAQSSLESIEYALQSKSSISLGYVQHSKLEATGNVVITGKGGFNTNIVCGGSVIVKDKHGFFRGGEIKAGGNVNIYELGSLGGAQTKVEVPDNRAINSAVIHQGVVMKIGRNVKIAGTRMGDL